MVNKFLLAKLFLKKAFTYLFILLFFFYKNKSQTNLVPNYSFEQMNNPCASLMTVIPFYLLNWYSASISSVDYYNTCANTILYPDWSTVPYCNYGFQFPKTGNSFVGLATYAPEPISGGDSINHICEYITVKLNATLKANVCYYGEFYTSLADICKLGTNRIGMYLSQYTFTTSLGSFTNTIQPQVEWDTTKFFTDTLNWVKVSGTFIANGNEQFLTIGNFKDGNHTKRTIITSGFISHFSVLGTKSAFHFVDDVVLLECSDTISIIPEAPVLIPNVFTPNNDGVNDVFKIELKNAFLTNFSIYDRWGLLIKSDDLKTHTTVLWDGRTTAGEACTAGVYFYTLQYTDVNNDIQKMNGYITLIK
jgi:gliding motility-associated-like protein